MAKRFSIVGHIDVSGIPRAVSNMRTLHMASRQVAHSMDGVFRASGRASVGMSSMAKSAVLAKLAMTGVGVAARTALGLMQSIAVGATVGGIAVGHAAKTWGDFTLAIGEVNTLLDPGSSAMDMFGEKIKKLAVDTGQSTGDITRGLYQAISAGIRVGEGGLNVWEFVTKSAQTAVGGLTDVEVAVDGLTTLVNAYGESTVGVDRAQRMMFETMKLAKMRIPDLASNLGMVVPFASRLGVSIEELGSMYVALTRAGMSSEQAGTRIRNIMMALIKPSKDATEAGRGMGMAWTGAANAALVQKYGLLPVLELIKERTGGTISEITKLFPNIRALAGALHILGEEGNFLMTSAFGDLEKEMGGITNNAEKAVKDIQKTFGFQFKQLMIAIQVGWAEVGRGLVEGMGLNLGEAADTMLNAKPSFRANAKAFGEGLVEGWTASGAADMFSDLFEGGAKGENAWKGFARVFSRVTGEMTVQIGNLVTAVDGISEAFNGLGNAILFVGGIWAASKLFALFTWMKGAGLIGGAAAAGSQLSLPLATGAASAGKMAAIGAMAVPGAIAGAGLAAAGGFMSETGATDNIFHQMTGGFFKESGGLDFASRQGVIVAGKLRSLTNLAGGQSPAEWHKPVGVKGYTAQQQRDMTRTGIAQAKAKQAESMKWWNATGRGAASKLGSDLKAKTMGQFASKYEPWSKMLFGRDLSTLSEDFKEVGRAIVLGYADIQEAFSQDINMENTVNVKVEDDEKKGGSKSSKKKIRLKERGIGAATGRRYSMSNYFILRGDEILPVPDEFIYQVGAPRG